MRNIIKNFVAILKVEIEDLSADIELLIAECQKKKDAGIITDYVYMENIALYRHELLAVQSFARLLEQTEPDRFEKLDDLVAYLSDAFRAGGYVRAINICIERKMNKVTRYVTQ
ncbi:MAG: hypothetical protein M0R34_05970 [Candidatus Marinimicrobia bacterium]|jgi:hypothetical protein|nr:hypothetical protein [Candidatus Neomarinimicrobiota bacterium]MCK9560445.1 hypothetical protein [Candidatus Neomarinimicrobiota bacterium]MDD5063039.1 hypothetical protein [Candidatus Neomarinimicrobiota bacterium]MDD5541239.1 hypothetical protein [Candidatus Neomarinimicrobiota bacterium]